MISISLSLLLQFAAFPSPIFQFCRFRLVYITFGILGIGTLLPWNVVLTETDYFLVRSHVPPTAPSIANNFPAVLANSYTIMCGADHISYGSNGCTGLSPGMLSMTPC